MQMLVEQLTGAQVLLVGMQQPLYARLLHAQQTRHLQNRCAVQELC